jgi:hypothetical protein
VLTQLKGIVGYLDVNERRDQVAHVGSIAPCPGLVEAAHKFPWKPVSKVKMMTSRQAHAFVRLVVVTGARLLAFDYDAALIDPQ